MHFSANPPPPPLTTTTSTTLHHHAAPFLFPHSNEEASGTVESAWSDGTVHVFLSTLMPHSHLTDASPPFLLLVSGKRSERD